MIKLSIRFFLSLCIFLVSGYSQQYAHTYQPGTCYSKLNHIQGAHNSCFVSVQYEQALIMESPYSRTEKNIIKEVTEIEIREEEESFSLKKYLKCSNCYSTFFYALLPETFFHYYKNRLSFFKRLTSPYKSLYLIFRVFRL